MPLVYKFNVLASLKDAGYSSSRLRNMKMLNESPIQQMRDGTMASWENLNTICKILNCQPGDLIEYIPEPKNVRRYKLPPNDLILLAVFL